MYGFLRPLLFRLDAETSHDLVLGTLGLVSKSKVLSTLLAKLSGAKQLHQPISVMGIDFPNPVGMAAGLDKQGKASNALHAMGFGWIELGTVTPLPQPGNPKPRMFRLPESSALINRMGFNSVGLDQFSQNLKTCSPKIIKGINIGKNAATPINKSVDDYIAGLRGVYDFADYVAINISSPNTQDLRELQNDQALNQLLSALDNERQKLGDSSGTYVPLVLKIAPDIDQNQIDAITKLLLKYKIDGVAATNTTVSRNGVENHPAAAEVGGLSGVPLQKPATAVISSLYKNLQDEIPIIGMGGINDVNSAREKFEAGAKLIQLYTGFIYRGPKLIKEILQGIG